jgi:two-component system sensor histidine kinase DegS
MRKSQVPIGTSLPSVPNPIWGRDAVSTLNPSIFLQLQEEERQRLAHALMDGPGQILANALMEIEYSLPLLEKNPQVAIAGLNALRNELRNGLSQLQNYVAELQPPLLEEMGLGQSVNQYVKKFGKLTGLRVECQGCELFHERFPITIEIALFRILQEALMNVQTHSKASRVRVELVRGADQVQITIQDNGRGFVPRAQPTPQKRQLGLIAMRDRAELLRGQLQLFSEVGHGVRVVVTIPYHGHPSEVVKGGGPDHHEYAKHTVTRPRRARPDTGNGQKKSKSPARGRTK